jgi:hypothetical protein
LRESALSSPAKHRVPILDDISYVSKYLAATSVLFQLIGMRYAIPASVAPTSDHRQSAFHGTGAR